MTDVSVKSANGNRNILNTHWTKSDIDLSRGLDFSPRGPVLVRVQHLNHERFEYSFTVINSNPQEVVGTFRVFIAPTFNENGFRMAFDEQRKFMIEMDKFTHRCK